MTVRHAAQSHRKGDGSVRAGLDIDSELIRDEGFQKMWGRAAKKD
jgi:hypothetical protein